MKGIRYLRGRASHLASKLGSGAPRATHLARTKLSANLAHTKVSMQTSPLSSDLSSQQKKSAYSSPLTKTQKQEQDKFSVEYNSTLKRLAEMRQELRGLLAQGIQAATAHRRKQAAEPLDKIIGWSEQLDKSLMEGNDRKLFGQALAYRGTTLTTGTFEDAARAKILLQRALEFDPSNKLAQQELKSLAIDEALGKIEISSLKTNDTAPEHTLSLLKQFEQVCQSAHQFQQKLEASLQRGIAAADEYDWYEAVKHLDEVIHVGELKLNRNGKPDFENLTKEERQFFARAHAHRGKLLSIGTFEDEQQSKSYFRKALEYDPENALAKQWLTSYEAEEAFGNLRFDSSPSE